MTTLKQTPTSPSTPFQKISHSGATWSEVERTLNDIKKVRGLVPSFLNNLTDQCLPGSWTELKTLRFADNTALDVKLKALMGLSIASQIPCEMLAYAEQRQLGYAGATSKEQSEAVLVAGMTRHWSAVLNGLQIDKTEFKKEADKIFAHVKKMMESFKEKVPPEEGFLFSPNGAEAAYADIEKTLGLVPKFFKFFPKGSIAGAWSLFKSFHINPHTSLSGQQKELIALAVAAQIPCEYCIYFHRQSASLQGASEEQMQEAVAMAGLARQWSAVFHSPLTDQSTFFTDAGEMKPSPGIRH